MSLGLQDRNGLVHLKPIGLVATLLYASYYAKQLPRGINYMVTSMRHLLTSFESIRIRFYSDSVLASLENMEKHSFPEKNISRMGSTNVSQN